MQRAKLKKYRYVLLSERKDNFGRHNGYNRTKPKTILAVSRDEAKSFIEVKHKKRPYKLLLL